MTIFDQAAADGDVLITADSDFTNLLAARGSSGPSIVLLRHVADLPWLNTRPCWSRTFQPSQPTSKKVLWDAPRSGLTKSGGQERNQASRPVNWSPDRRRVRTVKRCANTPAALELLDR